MTQTLFYQHYSFSKHVYQKSVEELAWYDKPGHDGGRHQVVVVVVVCVALSLIAHPVVHH